MLRTLLQCVVIKKVWLNPDLKVRLEVTHLETLFIHLQRPREFPGRVIRLARALGVPGYVYCVLIGQSGGISVIVTLLLRQPVIKDGIASSFHRVYIRPSLLPRWEWEEFCVERQLPVVFHDAAARE